MVGTLASHGVGPIVHTWVFSGLSVFFPQFKNMFLGRLMTLNCPLDLSVCVVKLSYWIM